MSAPRGRTYRLQIDVIAEEVVTILEDGDFVLEDAVTGDYVVVKPEDLDQFGASKPPYTAHIVACIRQELLDDTHDLCDWQWRQSKGNWWYREGRCPTCNPRTLVDAAIASASFLSGEERDHEPDDLDARRVAWICGARHVRARPWLTASWVIHQDDPPHLALHDGPIGPGLHFDSATGPTFVGPDGIMTLAWGEALRSDAAWTSPWGPASDGSRFAPRSAAYYALATLVCLSDDWQVAPARFIGGDEDPLSVISLESHFCSAQETMIDYLGLLEAQFNEGVATGHPEYWHEPMWVGLRDGQSLVLIDEAGYLHTRGQRSELGSTAEEIEALVQRSVESLPPEEPKLSREPRRSTGAREYLGTPAQRVHERSSDVKASERAVPRVTIPHPSLDVIESEGGQHAWVWAVPLPYRTLSAAWSGAAMPASPNSVREDEGHFEHQIGYYASLFSFLTYSFGWTRPDKGLLWWYQEGRPADDERLALIRNSWEEDGNLLGFLAWLSSKPADLMSSFTLTPWVRALDESPLRLDADWARRLDSARRMAPWNGGHDPFHLGTGSHIAAPSRPMPRGRSGSTRPRLLAVDPESRTATYISDTIVGWYANLFAASGELPQLPNDRSWRVDVYVKPIGFMGTYRRSRDTGLWFAGRHRHHTVGN